MAISQKAYRGRHRWFDAGTVSPPALPVERAYSFAVAGCATRSRRTVGLCLCLARGARTQNRNDTTRVHVYADARGRIVGSFTLSAHTLDLTGLPESIVKGRSRFPVPATLLGRFAVDVEFAGRGLGRYFLGCALEIAYQACTLVVASALVVLDVAQDASPSAERLYASVGFISLSSNARRMILPMVEIERHRT